tara:strand:- start:619 stop:720 length:102 start_codon:yes stop_codon:yes gene_type:complete
MVAVAVVPVVGMVTTDNPLAVRGLLAMLAVPLT